MKKYDIIDQFETHQFILVFIFLPHAQYLYFVTLQSKVSLIHFSKTYNQQYVYCCIESFDVYK